MNLCISPTSMILLQGGHIALKLSSIGTGAMFSPPPNKNKKQKTFYEIESDNAVVLITGLGSSKKKRTLMSTKVIRFSEKVKEFFKTTKVKIL